ncbi:MAG: hypothetical protein PHP23_14815 [Desulfobacterales bacterium]|nr:hypothetical protein [Desulfobacterales bacterium]MDD4072856.1 hypothetical protein [Desulfobacterales bacterium]MDD4393947.1 hypothetical protein [Desulfobacterales bacterium]
MLTRYGPGKNKLCRDCAGFFSVALTARGVPACVLHLRADVSALVEEF